MSGILNEFDAARARYSVEEKTVYLSGPLINNSTFKYTLFTECRRPNLGTYIGVFFNLETWQCLVITVLDRNVKYRCYLLRFWLEEELPVLSVNIFEKQEAVMQTMREQFKEKCAGLILDGIINS